MAVELSELELRRSELELRRDELNFERAKLSFEFAKFGFRGTRSAAFGGMALILALALLSAFTPFKLETWVIVVIAFVTLIGSIAFGYLSLWELPKIVARIQNQQLQLDIGSLRERGGSAESRS